MRPSFTDYPSGSKTRCGKQKKGTKVLCSPLKPFRFPFVSKDDNSSRDLEAAPTQSVRSSSRQLISLFRVPAPSQYGNCEKHSSPYRRAVLFNARIRRKRTHERGESNLLTCLNSLPFVVIVHTLGDTVNSTLRFEKVRSLRKNFYSALTGELLPTEIYTARGKTSVCSY